MLLQSSLVHLYTICCLAKSGTLKLAGEYMYMSLLNRQHKKWLYKIIFCFSHLNPVLLLFGLSGIIWRKFKRKYNIFIMFCNTGKRNVFLHLSYEETSIHIHDIFFTKASECNCLCILISLWQLSIFSRAWK